MNIENIKIEVSNILGAGFKIYYNTSNNVIEDEAEDSTAVGVFRVNAGDIKPLQGIQGLEASFALELFIPCENQSLLRKFLAQLDKLIETTNGFIVDADGTQYRYILGFNVPKAVGETSINNGVLRQRFMLGIQAVLSSTALFGNEGNVYIDGELLTGVVRWDILGAVAMTNNFTVNDFISHFIQQIKTRKLTVDLLFENNDLHKKLKTAGDSSDPATFTVGINIAGEQTQYSMFMENFNLVGAKGQFIYANIIFAEEVSNGEGSL